MKHNLGIKEETKNKRMMIFSGSSSPELAEKIADNLDIKLGDVSRTHFKNGEIYVKFNESVRGADVFLIQHFLNKFSPGSCFKHGIDDQRDMTIVEDLCHNLDNLL